MAVHHTMIRLTMLIICYMVCQCSGNTVQWCPPTQVGTPLTLMCSTHTNSLFERIKWEITLVNSTRDLLTSELEPTTTRCDFTHAPCSENSHRRYEVKEVFTGFQLLSSLTIRNMTSTDHDGQVSCHSWNTLTGHAELVKACRVSVSRFGRRSYIKTLTAPQRLNSAHFHESPGDTSSYDESIKSNLIRFKRSSAVDCRDVHFIRKEENISLSYRTEVDGQKNISIRCILKSELRRSFTVTVRCASTNDSIMEWSNIGIHVDFPIIVSISHPWYICNCSVKSDTPNCGIQGLFVLKPQNDPTPPKKMTIIPFITIGILVLVILPIIIGLCVFIYRHGATLYNYYYFQIYHIAPPPRPPPRLPPRPSEPASIVTRLVRYDSPTEESDWMDEDTLSVGPDKINLSPTRSEPSNALSEVDGYLEPRRFFSTLNITCASSERPEYPRNIQSPNKELNLPAKPPLCGVARRASVDTRAAQEGWCRSIDRRTQSKQVRRGPCYEAEHMSFAHGPRSKTMSRLSGGLPEGPVDSETRVKGHYDSQVYGKGDCDSITCQDRDCDSITRLKELY